MTALYPLQCYFTPFLFSFSSCTYFGRKIPRHVSKTLEEKNLIEFGNGEGFANLLVVICSHFLAVFVVEETDSQKL